ncbi:helix-turn-helix transcriptional regulator [Paenibacillus vulneris]|uniref:Helix-turn-helix domain-containing protein n=1 Tax=Paenibacillus vulneris TaxID=1133364 RepID=A0ABW3UTV5_9BACL
MIRLSLDKVMKSRNLTQKDIIEMSGISRNTVKALAANASTRIDFPTLDALCRGLGVMPGDLIEYIPDNTANKTP